MQNEKLLALDIGGVCLKLYPEKYAKALGFDNWTKIPERVFNSTSLLEQGLASARLWLNTIHEETAGQFTDTEIITAYNSILGEEIECIREWISELVKNGWKIVFLSNTSEIHVAHFSKYLNICEFVTGAIYSFDVASLKPDPKIYSAFVERYWKPDLYIDDNKENINTGELLGWNSFHFTESEFRIYKESLLNIRTK